MPERAQSHGDHEIQNLRERLAKNEWRVENVDDRLSQGAEAFSDLRNSIGEVRKDLATAHERFQEALKPKPIPVWKAGGLVFGVLCTAITVVWMFARYPDRGEFNEAQKTNMKAHEDLEDDLVKVRDTQQVLGTDQRLIKASQEATNETMGKIDSKLDKLLEPERRSR